MAIEVFQPNVSAPAPAPHKMPMAAQTKLRMIIKALIAAWHKDSFGDVTGAEPGAMRRDHWFDLTKQRQISSIFINLVSNIPSLSL